MAIDVTWTELGLPEPITIGIFSGDDRDFVLDLYDQNGAAVAATGGTITFTVKTQVDGTQVFTKSVGSGITISSSPTNRFTVTVSASDTASTDAGDYAFDCEITLSGSKTTCAWGTFRIAGDVA